MKMQNAEMEFVTFDAQDVIATSGGGVTDYYGVTSTSNGVVQASNFYNAANNDLTPYSGLSGLSGVSSPASLRATNGLKNNTAYVVTGVEKYDTSIFTFIYTEEDVFLANNPSAEGHNLYYFSSTTNKTHLTTVLDWLLDNQNYIIQ